MRVYVPGRAVLKVFLPVSLIVFVKALKSLEQRIVASVQESDYQLNPPPRRFVESN